MFTDKSTFLRVTVLTGAGVGLLLCTFAAADPPPAPEYRSPAIFELGEDRGSFGLALGYINSDALLDLVVSDPESEAVTVMLNTGRWEENPPTEGYGPSIHYPVAADLIEPFVALGQLNSDNKLDIVVLINDWLQQPGQFAILFNDGSGGFGTPVFHTLDTGPYSYYPGGLAVGDFDNDRKADIAIGTVRASGQSPRACLVVAWGHGDGQFTHQDFLTEEGEYGAPFEVVVADVDGIPGRQDLVMCDDEDARLHVCVNQGSRAFDYTIQGGVKSKGLTAGRFRPTLPASYGMDLVLTETVDESLHVFYNNGQGVFTRVVEPYEWTEPTLPEGIATGKLNRDGFFDVVTANVLNPPLHGGVSIFTGTGNSAAPFTTPPYNFSTSDAEHNAKPRRVIVGDVNNDGMDDIITANTASTTVSVLIQKATWSPPGG